MKPIACTILLGGPVNAMAKAYVEVDGVPVEDGKGWTRKLTFTEVK